ncbi:MAG: hypothetical protein DWB45_05590 [Xanthomonadales bacterium]|nr:MAG: hypothetical protein F9K31_06955 [Dokdonella sp.]MBC6942177.1 hypothetical protein [Xanthomonadales bacterium]MCC6596146.1 hypothetical protein [Rhodanobacteraceae bacterium]MDL1869157.1 hypothetical protein [Gammaproteobacteria bacterium PRO6]
MRQIYTSPRMENIDRVVALMAEHGIQTSVGNRRGYQGADWKRFSYTARADRDSWPNVSVVRAQDQTLARKLLREAGIEPATRFADELAAARGVGDPSTHRRASSRIKLVVLALICGICILIALQMLGS